eukprot:scaffold10504_cov124-Isochrysis_galbana.AAC.6
MIPHLPCPELAKSSDERKRMSEAISITSISCTVMSEAAVAYFFQADCKFENESTHMISELNRATQQAKKALDVL